MMPNDALIGSLALVVLSMLGISMMWFEDGTARKASMFFAFPVVLVMAFYMLSIPSLSVGNPFTMNIVSNTIYQNTNSTPLAIYATTHSATLAGYLGNSTSLTKVISVGAYNMSAYMLVEPNEYYKFNYTNATFIGQYSPQSQSQSMFFPESGMSQYASGALALFAIGLFMYISLILYAFTNMLPKSKSAKINMLLIFSLALATVAVLVFSAFYQVQLSIPSYQIVSGNSITTINVQATLSTPLATSSFFGPIIMLLSITATLLGLVLPAYW